MAHSKGEDGGATEAAWASASGIAAAATAVHPAAIQSVLWSNGVGSHQQYKWSNGVGSHRASRLGSLLHIEVCPLYTDCDRHFF